MGWESTHLQKEKVTTKRMPGEKINITSQLKHRWSVYIQFLPDEVSSEDCSHKSIPNYAICKLQEHSLLSGLWICITRDVLKCYRIYCFVSGRVSSSLLTLSQEAIDYLETSGVWEKLQKASFMLRGKCKETKFVTVGHKTSPISKKRGAIILYVEQPLL